MTTYENFPNPPIIEALIDIRVELPATTVLQDLEPVNDLVRDQFPIKEDRKFSDFQIRANKAGEPEVIPLDIRSGFVFFSSDRQKVLQTRLDGFLFSQLQSYQNWDVFKKETLDLWYNYMTVARPKKIKRVAVRYINRIPLPLNIDLKEYFLTTPEIAKTIPQGLSEFLMRLVIPQPDQKTMSVITQNFELPNADEKSLGLIFDIDVYQTMDAEPLEVKIENLLEDLRKIKNDIFFGSITEKTKELFR